MNEKFVLEMDLVSLVQDVQFGENDIRIVNKELEKEGFVFKENWSGERNNLAWWLEVDLKDFHKIIGILTLLGDVNIIEQNKPFGFTLEFNTR